VLIVIVETFLNFQEITVINTQESDVEGLKDLEYMRSRLIQIINSQGNV
jgi:hypothetical protein